MSGVTKGCQASLPGLVKRPTGRRESGRREKEMHGCSGGKENSRDLNKVQSRHNVAHEQRMKEHQQEKEPMSHAET